MIENIHDKPEHYDCADCADCAYERSIRAIINTNWEEEKMMENSARTFIHYANRFVNFILKNWMHQRTLLFCRFFQHFILQNTHSLSGES